MNATILVGLLVALGAGVAIGVQQVFTSMTGQMLGLVRGGFAIHVGGTIVGALMILVVVFLFPGNRQPVDINPKIIGLSILAGMIGMIILMSIAFALPRIGQVSGQGAIILAQLTVALVVDKFALVGGQPAPLDWRRIAGLAVMVVGIYLLLPKSME